ncbi:MAG: helix-turn-helix domain-containing protein [Oscillospiraceae bacterium]
MQTKHYDIWVKIGLNILHYRKELHLTQDELAETCNLSRNHVQRFESGAAGCSVDTLIDVAKALNVPLYKLFVFKD